MANPIPYIQLDCHLDESFKGIEADFGLIGFAIIVKLFQKIYGGEGYYCDWSDWVAKLFAGEIGAGVNVVQEVVSAAINNEKSIFDKAMYQKYGILTSHGIQKRFAEVAKRRTVVFDKPEYVIDNCAQNSENVCNQATNVCNSGQNVCNQTTSKVKQSKVKQSEEGADAPASPAPPPGSERQRLVDKYGVANVKEYEKRFREWKQKKRGNIRINEFACIEKWMLEDGVSKPKNKSSFDTDRLKQQVMGTYSNKSP